MVASFFWWEDFISYEEFKGELWIDLENDQTEDQKEKEEKSDEENEVIIGKRFAYHYVNAKSFIDSKIPTTVKDFNEIKDNTQTETNQNKTTDTVSTQNGTINVNNTSTTTSNSSSNNSSNNNSTQTTTTTITNSNGLTQAEINETKRLFDIIEWKSSPSQYSSYSSNDKDKVSESLNQLLELLDA